jgi:carbonic anhydrase
VPKKVYVAAGVSALLMALALVAVSTSTSDGSNSLKPGYVMAVHKSSLEAAAAPGACHWTYDEEAEWGDICNGKYPDCKAESKSQTPINIETASLTAAPSAQTLGWNIPDKAAGEYAHFVKGDKAADVSMEENNGHTFQVSHLAANFTYNNIVYNLKQFHMHTKSEHTINGKQSDLEIHFVHTTDDPEAKLKFLVVGVFFNAADGRSSPSFLRELVESITKVTATPKPLVPVNFFEVAQTVMIGSLEDRGAVDPAFVPNYKNYMTYEGSFTTPPCTGPSVPPSSHVLAWTDKSQVGGCVDVGRGCAMDCSSQPDLHLR